MGNNILSESDSQIVVLTDKFYQDYPEEQFREILRKGKRPYNCILFQTHYDYFICVPFRTDIKHNNGYLFCNSKRSKGHRSGLDYAKSVIIANPDYIGKDDAIVDTDEYWETMKNIDIIKKEVLIFVEEYISHVNGLNRLSGKQFRKKYHYSSLQYFHKEMGIG